MDLDKLVDGQDPDETVWRRRANIRRQKQRAIEGSIERGRATRAAINAAYIAYGANAAAVKRLAAERGCTRQTINSQLRQYRNGNAARSRIVSRTPVTE